jgi:phospholipid/cholesterol/gamma-HCH transport system substrate-binding protein
MLDNLQRVTRILVKNQKNLDRTIQLLGPFSRQFTDATGSGRWFDSYLQNLLPIPSKIVDPPSGSGGGKNTGKGTGSSGGSGQQSSNPLPFLP